jgi:hypothetical protein
MVDMLISQEISHEDSIKMSLTFRKHYTKIKYLSKYAINPSEYHI